MNTKLEDIIQGLTSDWKIFYKQRRTSWKHPCKKIFYEVMNFISDKICNDICMKQTQYNLELLSAIQEISDRIEKKKEEIKIFLCEDDFKEKNNILDVLLVFRSYQRKNNENIRLYLAPRQICSDTYLMAVLDAIKELEIKDVHFLFYLNVKERKELYEKSDIFISLKEHDNDEIIELMENIPIKKVVFFNNTISNKESDCLRIVHSLDNIKEILINIEELQEM